MNTTKQATDFPVDRETPSEPTAKTSHERVIEAVAREVVAYAERSVIPVNRHIAAPIDEVRAILRGHFPATYVNDFILLSEAEGLVELRSDRYAEIDHGVSRIGITEGIALTPRGYAVAVGFGWLDTAPVMDDDGRDSLDNNVLTPFDCENIQAEREQYEAEQQAERAAMMLEEGVVEEELDAVQVVAEMVEAFDVYGNQRAPFDGVISRLGHLVGVDFARSAIHAARETGLVEIQTEMQSKPAWDSDDAPPVLVDREQFVTLTDKGRAIAAERGWASDARTEDEDDIEASAERDYEQAAPIESVFESGSPITLDEAIRNDMTKEHQFANRGMGVPSWRDMPVGTFAVTPGQRRLRFVVGPRTTGKTSRIVVLQYVKGEWRQGTQKADAPADRAGARDLVVDSDGAPANDWDRAGFLALLTDEQRAAFGFPVETQARSEAAEDEVEAAPEPRKVPAWSVVPFPQGWSMEEYEARRAEEAAAEEAAAEEDEEAAHCPTCFGGLEGGRCLPCDAAASTRAAYESHFADEVATEAAPEPGSPQDLIDRGLAVDHSASNEFIAKHAPAVWRDQMERRKAAEAAEAATAEADEPDAGVHNVSYPEAAPEVVVEYVDAAEPTTITEDYHRDLEARIDDLEDENKGLREWVGAGQEWTRALEARVAELENILMSFASTMDRSKL